MHQFKSLCDDLPIQQIHKCYKSKIMKCTCDSIFQFYHNFTTTFPIQMSIITPRLPCIPNSPCHTAQNLQHPQNTQDPDLSFCYLC